MRNRAKCKLCGDIIESYTVNDYVECSCGEIAVDGGLVSLKAIARNFDNFFRVDDKGNTFQVKYEEEIQKYLPEKTTKPTKKELIDMLEEMAKNIDRLPQHAMMEPITHADHYSLILLLSSILKAAE